jgi:hypothetical protein
MPEQNEQYFKQNAAIVWLWAGVLAGPAAIALNQQLAYLLVTLNCSYGARVAIWPVMLLMVSLATAGAFISWQNWQRTGMDKSDGGGDAKSRSRFMAIVGLLFSGLSILVIVAMWVPVFFYRQCQR